MELYFSSLWTNIAINCEDVKEASGWTELDMLAIPKSALFSPIFPSGPSRLACALAPLRLAHLRGSGRTALEPAEPS
jgi:hypothetical protein